MINRIIGKLAESDNALVDRKRVNIREALNKIDCEHYTDFLNLYECANLSLDKKKALAQELVKEEVDLKVIESFFDEDDYADAMEDGYWEDRIEQEADKTIYNKLKEILPPEHIDNHETDLYVVVCPESTRILKNYEYKSNVTRFEDEDGIEWYDIPFAYDPAWDEKLTESKSLLETGEWMDDEEGIAWKEQLVDLIHNYTDLDNIEIEDVNGFDKYQGPYVYDSGLEIWTHPEAMDGLLIHDTSYTNNPPAWYAIFSREDFENFKKGNLMPVGETSKEKEETNIRSERKKAIDACKEFIDKQSQFDDNHLDAEDIGSIKKTIKALNALIKTNGPFTESVLPRNAKTITATPRDGGASMKLTKKDGV